MIHLLVYGASIYLTGISSQLTSDPEIQITHCDSFADLGSLSQFNAVLIDLHNPTVHEILHLLRSRPNLRIIGLNAAAGTLVDIQRQAYATLTLHDLLERIKTPPA
jgi:hypothetical protein